MKPRRLPPVMIIPASNMAWTKANVLDELDQITFLPAGVAHRAGKKKGLFL